MAPLLMLCGKTPNRKWHLSKPPDITQTVPTKGCGVQHPEPCIPTSETALEKLIESEMLFTLCLEKKMQQNVFVTQHAPIKVILNERVKAVFKRL